jgi:hypothetical protein
VFSTLCEDVYSLVNTQLDLVHEFLLLKKIEKTDTGAQLVMSILLSIIRNLHKLQQEHRDRFLIDLESSCAAANDLMRMIECFDDVTESVNRRYPGLKLSSLNKSVEHDHDNDVNPIVIESESSDLVALYANDAVYAVERSHTFLMQVIYDSSIQQELFSQQWEEEYVFNEVAIAIVKTSEDFLNDCYSFLSCTYLYSKLVGALISSIVSFYIQCLLGKADRVRRRGILKISPLVSKERSFRDPRNMVLRMMYDIEVFRLYFCTLVKQMPQLARWVEDEISILLVLHECLMAAVENENQDKIKELILVLHKRTGADVTITKSVVKDLWLLARGHMDLLDDAIMSILNDLKLLSENLRKGQCECLDAQNLYSPPISSLKKMLKQHYESNPARVFNQPFGQCFNILCEVVHPNKEKHKIFKSSSDVPEISSMTEFQNGFDNKAYNSKSIIDYWKIPSDLISYTFSQGNENPSAHNMNKDDRHRPQNHEEILKSLIRKMSAELKLNNIRFITKCPKLDLERRMAEIGGLI